MKLCKVCNIEKDNSQFGKLKSSKDGLNYYCKICHSKKMSEYRNTEVYKAKRKENHIINRDFYLEQKKEYYIPLQLLLHPNRCNCSESWRRQCI